MGIVLEYLESNCMRGYDVRTKSSVKINCFTVFEFYFYDIPNQKILTGI